MILSNRTLEELSGGGIGILGGEREPLFTSDIGTLTAGGGVGPRLILQQELCQVSQLRRFLLK